MVSFSHMKPVFYQSKLSGGKRLQPPFSDATMKTLNLLKKII